MKQRQAVPWTEIVEFVRTQDNGVMAVDLYFGHDGDNVCTFNPYKPDPPLATGCSGRSMQEAVECCYYDWHLRHRAQIATKSG